MKKMPTIFVRQFNNCHKVKALNQVNEGCEWWFNGEGYATEKFDGTCCLVKDGELYKRFDYKEGRTLPKGAIPCQECADPITKHFPHWLKVDEDDPSDKWFIKAFNKSKPLEDGTYELVGLHFKANPYKLEYDVFLKHGSKILPDVPRDFEGIREYLKNNKYIEGIVFYRGNGEMCKIKRSDFKLAFPVRLGNKMTTKDLVNIEKYYKLGYSSNLIGKKLNLNGNTIRKYLKDMGYEINRKTINNYEHIIDNDRSRYLIDIYDLDTDTLVYSFDNRKDFFNTFKDKKPSSLDKLVWRLNRREDHSGFIFIDHKKYKVIITRRKV